MQTILTGIRCNDELTIGNYLGAIQPLIKMAKEKSKDYQVALFVPDLHSFTTPVDHDNLYANSMKNLRLFVAAGLPINLENVELYRQSRISPHSELNVILNNFASFGVLSRMTEFKTKMQDIRAVNTQVFKATFETPTGFAKEMSTSLLNSKTREFEDNHYISAGLFNYPVKIVCISFFLLLIKLNYRLKNLRGK